MGSSTFNRTVAPGGAPRHAQRAALLPVAAGAARRGRPATRQQDGRCQPSYYLRSKHPPSE